MGFELVKTTSTGNARAGVLCTDHGAIETPIFMPVGTQGTVKTVPFHELEDLQAQIMVRDTSFLLNMPSRYSSILGQIS